MFSPKKQRVLKFANKTWLKYIKQSKSFYLVTNNTIMLSISSAVAENCCRTVYKRIHCEIFLSDYFMKHSLMHISLRVIGFHEIHVKHVKRNPSWTIISKCSICLEYIFAKNTTKQKTKRKKSVRVKPWLKSCRYASAFNNTYLRSWWLMGLENQCCFVSLFNSYIIEQLRCLTL